ncbi:MAG: FUSC family protein [Clostridia bacterium]|nr:FUSC family protein [Clostridia bacterium]
MKLPKIGMRITKTFIAVFLCFLVSFIRKDGVPFYSAIAAILCMQPDVSNSIKVGLNRAIGTFIGGIFGILILTIFHLYIPIDIIMLRYFIASLMLIPLIYISVLVKKPTASYITFVVFLSIVITHGNDINPFIFGINRMIDTLIGIGISILINKILPGKKEN